MPGTGSGPVSMKANRTVSSPALMEMTVWQKREILKNKLQNLFLDYYSDKYCDKCCIGSLLRGHQAKGVRWEGGCREASLHLQKKQLVSEDILRTYFVSQWSFPKLLLMEI